ncbi:MAG: beta-galactosidase [Planctomycetota bacterium]
MLRCSLMLTLILVLVAGAAHAAGPRATLTERGELLVDGKPFLPIFVWAQPASAIELHKGLGVNTLKPGGNEKPKAFLDALHKAGMIGLIDQGAATEALIDHPAALAWTVSHEADMAAKPGFKPDLSGEAATIWIEGEAADVNTFERSSWLDQQRDQLSGGRWLATQEDQGKAAWTFTVDKPGRYHLFVREFNKIWANPTKWTLDGGPARTTPRSLQATDVINWGPVGVGWARYGEVTLDAGEHTLTFEIVPGKTVGGADREPSDQTMFAVDAICFTTADRPPSGEVVGPRPRGLPETQAKRYRHVKSLDENALTWNIFTKGFFGRYNKIPLRWYHAFLETTDIASFDHYPVTGYNKPDRLPEVGLATAKLVELSRKNQPVWTIVEASDQDLSWTADETRGPTPAEMRAEVWSAIANGAQGIGYFTIAFNPFRWNHLTDEVKAEMKRTNGELSELAGPIVMGGTDRALTVTGDEVGDPNANGKAIQAIRKDHDGKVYVIAVNVTREAVTSSFKLDPVPAGRATVWKEGRSVAVTDGTFSDTFEPLAVHVYVLER